MLVGKEKRWIDMGLSGLAYAKPAQFERGGRGAGGGKRDRRERDAPQHGQTLETLHQLTVGDTTTDDHYRAWRLPGKKRGVRPTNAGTAQEPR